MYTHTKKSVKAFSNAACYEDGALMGFGSSLTDKHPMGFG